MFLGLGVGAGLSPADTTPPVLSSAVVASNGLTLTLTYAEALDPASVPSTSAYSVGGVSGTVSGVSVTGYTVVLTISSAIDSDDVVTVSYVVPGSGKVRDLAGNNAAALTSQACTNNSTVSPADSTAPTLTSAAISAAGTALTLTYNEALDAASVPATSAYTLGGTSSAVSAVNVTGSTVVLTLSPAAFGAETITVNYTAPGSGKVRDAAGNNVANLSSQAVTNGSLVLLTANRVAFLSTWYGDDTTHLTTGGTSKVTQFVNVDTSAAWAQGTTSNQASWQADSLNSSLNGFPSVSPDGGDYYFGTDSGLLAPFQGNTARTVYFVAAPTTAAANQVVFSAGNSASSSGYLAYGWEVGGHIWANANGGGAANGVGATVCANGQPYVVAIRQTGSLVKGWLNGVVDLAETAQNTGALASINQAGLFTRARSTNDLKFLGQAGEVLVYNVAHSDAEVAAQSAALFERWQLGHYRLVTLGDSLSNAFGSVSGTVLANRVSLSSNSGKWQRYSGSTNGYTTSDALSVFAARVTARRRWSAARDVLHLWIGTNDVTQTNDSAATIYGRITTLIDNAQALGYRVVVNTCILRSAARKRLDGTTQANPTILALNALILANTAGAEAVYDAYNALNVVAGAEGDTAPNTYYSDDTHLTDAGYSLLAAGQQAAIDSVA